MNGWRCSARVDDGKMQFSRGKLWDYVEQAQTAIEMALAEAEISQDEWTVSLDNMVQLALFVYFEGFFELPVSSSELALSAVAGVP